MPQRIASPQPADLLAVGVVTATHGVTGELKVRSFSGEPGHLLTLREAQFRKGEARKTLALDSVRQQGTGVIVRIAGLDSPERARTMVGWEIWVPRPKAAPLAADEYYAADLCRCSVWFGQEEIGHVRSVWDGGPAQLLEVVSKDGRTHLVPFIEHFVGDVQLSAGKIYLMEDEIVR